MKVFAGSSNPGLAAEIAEHLGQPLGRCEIVKFANENIKVRILENVRGKDVFVIQTAAPPVNENLVELLIFIDALKHASADRITAVLPYYPYARSDKKDEPRISITARLVADLLQTAGANRVLTMNLHSPQIMGFFRIPVDQLLATQIFAQYFSREDVSNAVVVAPDAGSAKRADMYAFALRTPLAILDKRRYADNDSASVLHVIGEVEGKRALIFDDEIATGGSVIQAAEALFARGATEVCVGAVHGVLCGDAPKRLLESPIKEVVVSNTVPVPQEKRNGKIKVLSVAKLFAEAIRRIHEGESVSGLFRSDVWQSGNA